MPAPWGVTSTGFNAKTAAEIRADMVASARRVYGPAVNTDSRSRIGQFIDIVAKGRNMPTSKVKELATGWFTEAGGKIDAGETPAQAASRELEEESCGLFALDVAHASSERVTVDRGRYSAFFVPVRCEQGIRRDLFASNRAEVESSGCPACWRETTAMTRVYLDDLAAALPRWANGAPLDVRDAYGDAVTVHHRTAAAVNNFLKMGCAGLGRAGVRWNDLAVGRARLSRCDVRNSIIQQYSSYNL